MTFFVDILENPPTSFFLLTTPDEFIEHEADQRVLQCPEVTENGGITVHQGPGFAPEKKLSRRETSSEMMNLILKSTVTFAHPVTGPELLHRVKHFVVVLDFHAAGGLMEHRLLKLSPDLLAVMTIEIKHQNVSV